MSDAEKETTFDEVWEELKANDTTGIFQRAEEAAAQSVADIEYAFDSGYKHGFIRTYGRKPTTFRRWEECHLLSIDIQ